MMTNRKNRDTPVIIQLISPITFRIISWCSGTWLCHTQIIAALICTMITNTARKATQPLPPSNAAATTRSSNETSHQESSYEGGNKVDRHQVFGDRHTSPCLFSYHCEHLLASFAGRVPYCRANCNCSDLRGSADHSAYRGGTTEHGNFHFRRQPFPSPQTRTVTGNRISMVIFRSMIMLPDSMKQEGAMGHGRIASRIVLGSFR